MKSILILLLLVSCSHGYYSYTDGNWHPAIFKESKIVCPKDYIYNQHSGYCHYVNPPVPKLEVKPIKTVKKLKKDGEAVKCVKLLNQCGVYVK